MDFYSNGYRDGPLGRHKKVAQLDEETITVLRTFFGGWYERPPREKLLLGQARIDGVPMDYASPERDKLQQRLGRRERILCASLRKPDPCIDVYRVQAIHVPDEFHDELVSSACPLIGVYYRSFDVGLAKELAGEENLEVMQILLTRVPEEERAGPRAPVWECYIHLFTREEVEVRWLVCRLNETHQHLGLPHK